MSLKVSTEPKENRQLQMTIEVDQERVDQELRKAARKVAGQIRIPGFRKGRAPYDIIVRNVGLGALFEEFVDELGQELYKDAIEQENIEPYAVASLDSIDMDPLRYTLTIPLAPEVKLGDYRSLRVEETKPEIDEEEVQARVDELLERQAGYEEVDRPSEYGDLMSIDVRAVVLDEEGNETDVVVLDETDWDVTPDEENPMEPAGFDEQLVGMLPGEEKTFDIAWPEDSPSMYAGKNVRFQVTVHQIQAYQQPELTDEVAQSIGDYESAEALVESIRETMREERTEGAESAYLEEVLEKLIEMSELDYPPAAVELQIDQMMRNTDMQLRRMGMQGMQQYLQMINQSAEQYRDSLREQAEKFLRRNLVIAEVTKAEQLKVSDREFDDRLSSMFGEVTEETTEEQENSRRELMDLMRRGPNREAIDDQVLYEKTIGRILAIARGEEVPEPGAEPPAAEAESETEAEAEAESETQEETVVESEAVDVLEEPAATEGAADPMAEVAEESEGKHS
jgi:trigger factor